MSRRQTPRPDNVKLPRIWLMTDSRFGDDLLPAIKRLPPGSGVIFRHYDLTPEARRTLFRQVRRLCRQRNHKLLLAGAEAEARRWRADGYHARAGRLRSIRMIRSAPVHNQHELAEARRNGVDLVFVSPVFETASHPSSRTLGRAGLLALARMADFTKVIALGGMDSNKAAFLNRKIVYGWAAIDAFRLNPV